MPDLTVPREPDCDTGNWALNQPHEWERGGSWGVIIGISRCKKCGKLAQESDFAPTIKRGHPPHA